MINTTLTHLIAALIGFAIAVGTITDDRVTRSVTFGAAAFWAMLLIGDRRRG